MIIYIYYFQRNINVPAATYPLEQKILICFVSSDVLYNLNPDLSSIPCIVNKSSQFYPSNECCSYFPFVYYIPQLPKAY